MKKVGRKNEVVKHIGTARTPLELKYFQQEAQEFINNERIKTGVISLFDSRFTKSDLTVFLNKINFVKALDTVTYQFFHHFYDFIGFSSLKDDCFKDLVIARIIEPLSKAKTRDLLEIKFGKRYSLTTIYRTLAKIYKNNYQSKLEQIVCKFVKQKISSTISVLFFDVTTLYYESFDEDNFRKCGFSKDHKANQPQIVVALTVTKFGIPLHLQVFEGNKFEGHTMLPCITELINTYQLKEFVVVADSAMLSKNNLDQLENNRLKYIVGARLGNLNQKLFEEIINKVKKVDGKSTRFNLNKNKILVISYSSKRAAKDKHSREKQIKKAQSVLNKPSTINNRYKFLTKIKNNEWQLNQKNIIKTQQLEGLKGYITNATGLNNNQIIQKYSELWQVEKSFRMSKSDLKARPIFHTLKESINAHLLIVFIALVIARYVELITGKSIKKVVEILNPIKEIIVQDKISKQTISKFTNLNNHAKQLLKFTNINWVT